MNSPVVRSINFLVPCVVNLEIDGEPVSFKGSVDYLNHKFHSEEDINDDLVQAIWAHMSRVTHPPEDKYQADETVYDNMEKATDKFQEVKKQHQGGMDE